MNSIQFSNNCSDDSIRYSTCNSNLIKNNGFISKKASIAEGKSPTSVIQDEVTSEVYLESLRKKISYNYLDTLVIVVSMLFYLTVIGFDIYLAYLLYHLENSTELNDQESKWWWSYLTLSFVITSSLIMSGCSIKWFWYDQKKGYINHSKLLWTIVIFFHLIQLGPIYRFLRCIKYSWKFVRHQNTDSSLCWRKFYLQQIVYKEAEVAKLCLIGGFLNSALQLILQLYIMAARDALQKKNIENNRQIHFFSVDTTTKIQGTVVILSLISTSWSLVAFQKALRITSKVKKMINKRSMTMMFLWNFFTIGPRAIALALFAYFFKVYFFVFCISHWCLMLIWNIWHKTNLFDTFIWKLLLNCALAFIQIFGYFNVKEGQKRHSVIFYYVITYCENIILILLWYIFTYQNSPWYSIAAIEIVLGSFWIGIVDMLIHYSFYHPNQPLQRCCRNKEREIEISRKISAASAIHCRPKPLPQNDDDFVVDLETTL